MRNFKERVQHMLLFEIILLIIFTPIVAMVFDKGLAHTGVMSLGLSLMAMVMNALYNYGFDKALLYLKRPLAPRSFKLRTFHSVLFELVLLLFTLPMMMWWLDISFLQALLLDMAFVVFVPLYALIFNWVYDFFFPMVTLEKRSV